MATCDYELLDIPKDPRAKELWLQHAAGMILFEDARQYAIEEIGKDIDPSTRAKIVEGIDNALYGVMMVIDGVSGQLQNEKYKVNLEARVNLLKKGKESDQVIQQIDLFDGDGMCMGYHGWLEGDFGENEVAKKVKE